MAAPLTKQTSPESNVIPKATERTTAEQQPLEYTQNAILLRGDWAYLHLYLHLIKCVNVNMIIVLIGHSPKYKIYNNAIICQLNISGETNDNLKNRHTPGPMTNPTSLMWHCIQSGCQPLE